MRRTLFTSASILSTIVLCALCACWVRSRFVRDYSFTFLPWPADEAGTRRYLKLDLDSGGGQVEIAWHAFTAAERETLRAQGATDWFHRTFPDPPKKYDRSIPPTAWNALGFKSYSGRTHSSIAFPYWAAVLLPAALPALWANRFWRRRQRVNAGLCPTCGYDCRATPGRCPECGTANT